MRTKKLLLAAVALLAPLVSVAQSAPQAPSSLCIDDADCVTTPVSPTPARTNAIKWHPGHYLDTDTVEKGGDSPSGVSLSTLTSIANTPFKGVLVHYSWGLLEPTRGNYDFSRIRTHRDALKSVNKRLIIYLQDRTYGGDGPPPSHIMPAYLLRDPEFEGGWVKRGASWGVIPKLWLPSVMDRQIALINALGAEFNDDPWVEMFSWEETALYNELPPGYTKAAMVTQMRRLADGMSAAFPNTTACILTNFFHDLATLRDLIDYFISKRICVGGPDVRPDNNVDGSEILSGQFDNVDRRKKTAIMFHNEWRSLSGQWTIGELQAYAHNTNGQHYTAWSRKESGEGLTFSGDVRPWVVQSDPPTHTACPENYKSACVTN